MEKTKNTKSRSLLKVFLGFFATLILCIAALRFVFVQNSECATNYLLAIAQQQEILIKETVKDAAEVLNQNGTEDSVVEDIIKNAETSGSRYWFFALDDEVIYFRNDEKSNKYKNRSIQYLSDGFKQDGGKNVDTFINFITNQDSGSIVFSPSNAEGNVVASFKFFEANNQKYVIGFFSTQYYLLNVSKITKHNTYLLIFTVVFSALFLSIELILSLSVYKKKKVIAFKNRDIQAKNTIIERLNDRLTEEQIPEVQLDIYDNLTGMYNKSFLETLLAKADKQYLPAFSVVALNIIKLGEAEERITKNVSIDVMLKAIELLDTIKSDNVLVVRTGRTKFAVLVFNKTEVQVKKIIGSICDEFDSYYKFNQKLILCSGMCHKKKFDQTVYDIYNEAEKNLNLNTMIYIYDFKA